MKTLRKILLIYNPHAGKELIKTHLSDILIALQRPDSLTTVFPTSGRGDAYRFALEHGCEYDEVIVSGGENIYPVQIEDFIRRYDKVKDVAVIGLPDRRLGEKTAAVIEIKEGMECNKEEIVEFCMGLPRYKRPKEFIFEEIPRNATGKIEKPKLRKKYGADRLVEQENQG